MSPRIKTMLFTAGIAILAVGLLRKQAKKDPNSGIAKVADTLGLV